MEKKHSVIEKPTNILMISIENGEDNTFEMNRPFKFVANNSMVTKSRGKFKKQVKDSKSPSLNDPLRISVSKEISKLMKNCILKYRSPSYGDVWSKKSNNDTERQLKHTTEEKVEFSDFPELKNSTNENLKCKTNISYLFNSKNDIQSTILDQEEMKSRRITFGATPDASDYSVTESIFTEPFLKLCLDNDKRVKKYEKIFSSIYVHFWNIPDAINFYSQYYGVVPISFSSLIDTKRIFSPEDFESTRVFYEPWRNLQSQNEAEKITLSNLSVLMDVESIEMPEDDSEECLPLDNLSENSTFEEKVSYFTKMSKFFSINEVKRMQSLASLGILDFIFINTKEVAVGMHTNIIMQTILKTLTQEQIFLVVNQLGYDIGPISATKYGAYVVQIIISLAESKDLQTSIVKYIGANGYRLLKHPIGNYSIQKILRFQPRFVLNLFLSNLTDLCSNELGIRVFRRCSEFFDDYLDEIKKRLETTPNIDSTMMELVMSNFTGVKGSKS
ncbi:hypothetical protein CWI38_0001p0090 [Hamiltosporidium tvaerminnensis]|uniref:PUM-HD domain-containing protein n=2 Tax=Hamiltosporidium TaxID=1176354 RepID=A0A4Q9LLC9_9MICR|nr:hypothetical protein CWI36_0102p0020 [Hamiltosporidium magnivora]TBU21038.1 hypothetical protein CWI38_0001p0090 [Hamiltosporidium tvaerminnensis]